jgi:hypothetical protein
MMHIINVNGMVEQLDGVTPRQATLFGYGREQPGRTTADAIRQAARQDRRRQQRPRPDPLRGRLFDMKA